MTGLRWAYATHVGRRHTINEDTVLAAAPVFAIADGMGGHAAGEVASQIAAETLHVALASKGRPSIEALVSAVRTANAAILERSYTNASQRGMGTTISAVALVNHGGAEQLAVVNVGDSRTYVLQDGHLLQITRDHSYVEELIAAGEITPEQARVHPRRNIVTRALGIEPDVEVDTWEVTPYVGDRYLICSDGLVDEVEDTTIAQVLRDNASPQAAADQLVEMANDAGGRDNISVLIIDVTEGEAFEGAATAPPPQPDFDGADASLPASDADTVLDAPLPPPVRVVASGLVPAASGDGYGVGDVVASSPTRRRRVSVRGVLFLLAVLAVLGTAFGAVEYYGRDGYYVAFANDRVTAFQGRHGGLLWVKPHAVTTFELKRADLAPEWQTKIDATLAFTTREAANLWYSELAQNPKAVPALATTTTTAATTIPPTTVVLTTAPTSLAPGLSTPTTVSIPANTANAGAATGAVTTAASP